MSLDLTAANHICNVIRREIQTEYPYVTLLFIAYEPGREKEALNMRRSEIERHPSGPALLSALHDPQIRESDFPGIVFSTENRFLNILARDQALGCFFVNFALFEEAETLRQHLYALSWQALSIVESVWKGRGKGKTLPPGLIRPPQDEKEKLYSAMIADVFSAILMSLTGQKGMIEKLGRQRAHMALSPLPGYQAERYPYLLAFDAAQIVYQELEPAAQKSKPFKSALSMTREVETAFDDKSTKQWYNFAAAAQEMAWMGIDKSKILSAAVYTSEDPYMSPTAHLVADMLNIEPALMPDMGFYNAFADQEVNERHHNRICDDRFQIVMAKAAQKKETQLFIDESLRQNELLLKGDCLGWCAPAMLAAAEFLQNQGEDQYNLEKETEKAFHAAVAKIPWWQIRKIARQVASMRREAKPVSALTLVEIAGQDPELGAFEEAFKNSKRAEDKEAASRLVLEDGS